VNLPTARYPDSAARAKFLKTLVDDIGSSPGVTGATLSSMLPLTGEGSNNTVTVDGTTVPELQRPIADRRMISEDYFRVMGVPMLQGRTFQASDPKHQAIISAGAAAKLWPGVNPLGKLFHFGDSNAPALEVVGVAGDVRGDSLQASAPLTIYLPYWQANQGDQRHVSLAVRTAADPASISGAVRAEIRRLDSEMPLPRLRTMREIMSASVAQRRFQLTLVMLFAGIGLVLASLGIYGVVSYGVQQRRGEMGIRMALGATASDLRSQVMRQGLTPVAIGLAAGIVAALAIGRLVSGLLFGVSFADPLTIVCVSAVLLLVAAAACYVPALRVTRADPLTALRYE
jgi:putative ABC transport system permease protein